MEVEGFRAQVRLEGQALEAWKLCEGHGEIIFDREPKAVEGEALLNAFVGGHDRTVVAHDGRAGFDVERTFELTVRATALRSPRPVPSRLPFHYHILPGFLRRFAGKTLMARKQFGRPDHGAELLRHARRVSSAVESPRSLLILTHDVDTPRGLARAVRLAEKEAERNLRAVYFVVPGMRRLDTGAVRALKDAGHEIGVHGLDHSCKLPYLSPPEMTERLARAKEILSEFSPRAFRSPALARTPELFDALGAAFTVDSSVPYSEPGDSCGMLRPFTLGNLLELPLTMPMDSTLMMMGLSPAEIAQRWHEDTGRLTASGAAIVLTTHPEPQFSGTSVMEEIYLKTVEHALETVESLATLDGCIEMALKSTNCQDMRV